MNAIKYAGAAMLIALVTYALMPKSNAKHAYEIRTHLLRDVKYKTTYGRAWVAWSLKPLLAR